MPSRTVDLDDVEPPRGAGDVARERRAHARCRRRRRDPRDGAHERDADEAEDDERRARVARQPDQRHAAAVGQQRRLARLDRQPVADDLAESRHHGRREVARADGRAGGDDDDVVLGDALAEHALELARRRPGRSRAAPARRPPRGRGPRAPARRRRAPGRAPVRRSPAGTISSPVEMIPTRGRACAASSVTPAEASRPRSAARSGRPAGASMSPGRRLLAGLQDAVAGSDAAQQLDVAGHRLGRVLDHHDRVGPAREQPAGRDRHRRARTDLAVGDARPCVTAPASSRNVGSVSEAAYVSAARTA